MELLDFDYKAASCLLSYPDDIFPLFDKAILEAETKVKVYYIVTRSSKSNPKGPTSSSYGNAN
jgi:hypothetical protein